VRRNRFAKVGAWVGVLLLLGTSAHNQKRIIGSFKVAVSNGPFVSGSRLSIDTPGISGPLAFSLVGPGTIVGGQFVAPLVDKRTRTTLLAATDGALAYVDIDIVPPPRPHYPLIAVAAYDSGIVLHDQKTFAVVGYAPIGGPPGDVAFSRNGDIYAVDTDGDALLEMTRAPWQMRATHGVPLGNEVAVDDRTENIFVTDRDVGGRGALTRITRDGTVSRVITGDTAEGLAIDAGRGIVYVGNVNDDSVAQIDATSMKVTRRIHSVERTFGIALDSRQQRLYVVSNTSPSMRSGRGFIAAIDLRRAQAPIVNRSSRMVFPLGVTFDNARNRVYVTDEASDEVYILNARTLRALRPPLVTCRTPWRPTLVRERLYVPCARSNKIDVFDARTLSRIKGAPFATGGFPLSVATWAS
jgi:DNA-binding beta-propeller fold protein YncE